MKPITSNEVRQAFLEFFEELNHRVVGSSPLPNYDNPTLLFTNAGMNQFVNIFLGKEKRDYNRAATSQKVMRVQGKHNDLENVGPSPRHHTFFEMLGNFSFGDYFKKEAIAYAWTFLTGVVGLPEERLWVTVYTDDDEAAELWQAHTSPDRILRFGKEDNFWEMGDTGPCGPCSEIHYYNGPLADQSAAGVNVGDAYVELWNLVFMQYEKDEAGNMTPLPNPSIDTGMGFERIVQVLQGKDNNYDTDLFRPVLDKIQAMLSDSDEERADNIIGYRVIADHGRAATFLIGDGVLPGNVGAGYVLRMIIRRAARFGRKVGFTTPFLAAVAQVFIDQMGEAYPELQQNAAHIKHTVTREEERFARTLDNALERLDTLLSEMHQRGETEIEGEVAFNLYATHGLPVEITRDLASERGFTVDEAGFKDARQQHALASGSGAFGEYEGDDGVYDDVLQNLIATGRLDGSGVDHDPYSGASMETPILALIQDGATVDEVNAGDPVEVVTAATPFYVESGGEVSDTGHIDLGDNRITVTDTRKPVPGLVVHLGRVDAGRFQSGDVVQLTVDRRRRHDIRRNHTATHILHQELRNHLGEHVTQQGSLVAPDRLRFDFSYGEAVPKASLSRIEKAINEAILANRPVTARHMGRQEAIDKGAMALFGEKYGEIVRTIKIGDGEDAYSFELCGGLHVDETGEIGLFHFTSEGAVAAGIRRVEAVTGRGAYNYSAERLHLLDQIAGQLNTPVTEVDARLESLLQEHKQLQKEMEALKRDTLLSQFDALMEQVRDVAGVPVLTAQIPNADADGLRQLVDRFRERQQSGVVGLGTVKDDRPLLIVAVSKDLNERGLNAGSIVRAAAKVVGGGGGGRPNLAQAGGRDPENLPQALALVAELVAEGLS